MTAAGPARFVRVHRAYLINLDRLTRVDLDERENRIALLTRATAYRSAALVTHD